jgi:hypothetical protein
MFGVALKEKSRFMYYQPSWAFHRDAKEPFPLNFIVDFNPAATIGRSVCTAAGGAQLAVGWVWMPRWVVGVATLAKESEAHAGSRGLEVRVPHFFAALQLRHTSRYAQRYRKQHHSVENEPEKSFRAYRAERTWGSLVRPCLYSISAEVCVQLA